MSQFRALIGASFLLLTAGTTTDAQRAIVAMDYENARTILSTLDPRQPEAALEWARYFMQFDDCEKALVLLPNEMVANREEAAQLASVAYGCTRSMAESLVITDEKHHVEIRYQNDDDQSLTEIIGETLQLQRDVLIRDLRVTLPLPLRVDIVSDQYTLSEMTGLPYASARTTGTVAIAKFGRLVVVSPRAVNHGYDFRDTIAHELTHVALTKGSLDTAPLWLQEGIAKYEETRWRAPKAFDNLDQCSYVAFLSMQNHLDRDFNSLGPSLAMLPSAREAAVMYSELESFVRYYADVRHQSLADLIAALPSSKSPAEAIEKATKTAFSHWVAEWKQWVKTTHSNPPLATSIGLGLAKPAIRVDIGTFRVAQLLVAFGYFSAASKRFDTLPTPTGDPTAASWYSQAYAHSGSLEKALSLVTDSFAGSVSFWFQTRAQTYEIAGVHADSIEPSLGEAVGLDPLSDAACLWMQRLPEGSSKNESAKELCESARNRHQLLLPLD